MVFSAVKFYEFSTCKSEIISLQPGKYRFEAWGAQGGKEAGSELIGGKGGYSRGDIFLKKETKFFIHLGEKGGDVGSTQSYSSSACNGGGKGYYLAGGGGGSCDIRALVDDLQHRIIVAGGGGGTGDNSGSFLNAGYGGGFTGGDGGGSGCPSCRGGRGGNQLSSPITCSDGSTYSDKCYGGGFGNGGNAQGSKCCQGGGGGGWYGGSTSYGYSAGGGSGYVLTSTSNKPIDYFPEYSLFEMTNSIVLNGLESFPQPSSSSSSSSNETGHSGNSYFKITTLEYHPKRITNNYLKYKFDLLAMFLTLIVECN